MAPADEKHYFELERERARDRMAAEAQNGQEQAKMGWGLFIVALILSLIADVVELFTAGTLGWFVGLVIDFVLLLMLGFSKAGRKRWKKWIWGPLIEKIPFLNAIPLIRVVFLIWSFASSRSKILQTATQAATLVSLKK